MTVCPAKTRISLGIRPVWSESSLSAWRKLGSLVTHWAHSEDSDQTGRMPRLIWYFAGRTCHFVDFVMMWLKWHFKRIRPVWSEFSLSAWRKLGSFVTHWAHSEDSDQTGRMPRLIWVFAGRICHFVGFVMMWLKWHFKRRVCFYSSLKNKRLLTKTSWRQTTS